MKNRDNIRKDVHSNVTTVFIWKCFPVFIGTFPLETVLEDCQNRPH